jgi:hypothetical protein
MQPSSPYHITGDCCRLKELDTTHAADRCRASRDPAAAVAAESQKRSVFNWNDMAWNMAVVYKQSVV